MLSGSDEVLSLSFDTGEKSLLDDIEKSELFALILDLCLVDPPCWVL